MKEENKEKAREIPNRVSRKKVSRLLVIFMIMLLFVLSPLSELALSMGVMSVYSGMHERESILAERGLELSIPGGLGKGWYPFVMLFNPESRAVSAFLRSKGMDKEEVRLSILYNFPAFDLSWGKGCSRLFDKDSSYYNSFYGAYAVSAREPFGFCPDGSVNEAEIAALAEYDFHSLVLSDFGLQAAERVFEWRQINMEANVSLPCSEGWQRIDAELRVNGAAHTEQGFVQSYLQYGVPKYKYGEAQKPFTPIEMKGRIYAKYFSEYDISLFFYIVTADKELMESCDREIIQRSTLSAARL